MAIYANYSVRATVKVLEQMFTEIVAKGSLSAGNKYTVEMTKIFDLIAVNELKENQKKFGG